MENRHWEDLQPLRIPCGWTVRLHKLRCGEPAELPAEDGRWLFCYTEDILQLQADLRRRRDHRTETQQLTVDLGWYPDGDPAGAFRLAAVLDGDWERPLLAFTSRSETAVVETLEHWLHRELMPLRYIEDAEAFRKNLPARRRNTREECAR